MTARTCVTARTWILFVLRRLGRRFVVTAGGRVSAGRTVTTHDVQSLNAYSLFGRQHYVRVVSVVIVPVLIRWGGRGVRRSGDRSKKNDSTR